MHREAILKLLEAYQQEHPEEGEHNRKIQGLVRKHEDCFLRTCLPGHITASSWIVSHDLKQVLLTHHRKLGKWLQLGGHADGDPSALDVALREAREESGMQNFQVAGAPGRDAAIPFDIDVHLIPARKNEAEHEHHDIRYLLIAEANQALVMSDESNDLRWFSEQELLNHVSDESVLRLHQKAGPRLLEIAALRTEGAIPTP